ncbi:hypothetical protein RchiOBHm_Chr3g0462411 [Rosa chinensis]|uniref:Uncharacterized protein n=1 Tax=Rosa chinensis TaxID=74649 RepID=A0A2P6R8X5_ROSCH|nr:hypothetical protein RchiOBHm_Chr3g0462411 [Rosa chinensis]
MKMCKIDILVHFHFSPPFIGKCGPNAHFTIIYSNVPKKIEIELKIDSLRN